MEKSADDPKCRLYKETEETIDQGKFLDKIEGKADKEKTWFWLTNGTLKKETEGLILAAQEQDIRTKAIQAKIEKSADDQKCRLCKETDETIDHILSCCKKIAQTDSKQRHNYVAQMIHWNLCLKYRSDVDRLYLPRRSGGRGLLQVKQAVKEEEHALAEYSKQSEEPGLIEVKNQKLLKAQQTKNQYMKTALQTRADSWHNKTLHGKFLDKMEGKADKEKTWLWLTNGTLKKETEGLILAAQEQAIRTKAIQAKIEKSADDPKCRLCKETDETIDHILSCYKKIAQTDYKQRHNYVAQMIHWNLCLKYHLPATKNWWDHKPAKVLKTEHAKILWDLRMQTDKVLEHNTPDITVVEKKKVWIIDVAIPGDSRIDEKQQEKLSRYQDLKIELQRLWQKPVQVVPVVVGTLGAVPKDLSRHLETIGIDKITICQLQKATRLGSARII
ncbi:uncharacterized protein LOC134294068 [Anolis carolinensis]|uniref:uncharacterized protein LOC134294068 n=1 Tax=Anolis carolinensis TaxID=28377 RepID=UPI002F2B25BA